jgi:hypothetical protein
MSNIKFYHVGYTTVVTTSARDLEPRKEIGTTEVIDCKVADVVDKLRELGPYQYLSQRAVRQCHKRHRKLSLSRLEGDSQACYSALLSCLQVSIFRT